MKSNNIFLSTSLVILFLFSAFSSEAQTKSNTNKSTHQKAQIEVIQFHSEHRCMTCNKIEMLTKETLTYFSSIPFSLVNVDEKKNEKKAEEFEASGTALFLYNPETGAKKDLTDFAFMNAGNKEKFIAGLRKEIEAFQK